MNQRRRYLGHRGDVGDGAHIDTAGIALQSQLGSDLLSDTARGAPLFGNQHLLIPQQCTDKLFIAREKAVELDQRDGMSLRRLRRSGKQTAVGQQNGIGIRLFPQGVGQYGCDSAPYR